MIGVPHLAEWLLSRVVEGLCYGVSVVVVFIGFPSFPLRACLPGNINELSHFVSSHVASQGGEAIEVESDYVVCIENDAGNEVASYVIGGIT